MEKVIDSACFDTSSVLFCPAFANVVGGCWLAAVGRQAGRQAVCEACVHALVLLLFQSPTTRVLTARWEKREVNKVGVTCGYY